MNTTENNRLMAKFLQVDKNENGTFELPQYGTIRPNGNFITEFESKDLQYHKNWNWLMEVVEKIETKKYYKKEVQFCITKYAVKIQSLTHEDGIVISPCIFSAWATYGGTEKKEAVYNACLEFIKWYNQKNQ